MKANKLKKALRSHGYIADYPLARKIKMALATQPVAGAFLFGKAGTGKSFLPEVLAEINEIKKKGQYYFTQCFPGTRVEDLTLDILPSEQTKSGIKKNEGVITRAAKASHDGEVMLVMDEWDKTRPSADAFLLDFLQTGRVNYGDIDVTAKQENISVWLTMNDERDISEPLIRRLPKIDFEPLSPTLVKEALYESHGAHPHLESAITLYRRCLHSEMSKPCTIQELRQMLDALNVLKDEEDVSWDEIVFQYVTKTEYNHYLLKQAESKTLPSENKSKKVKLSSSKYNKNTNYTSSGKKRQSTTGLPSISKVRGVRKPITNKEKIDLKSAFGVVGHTEKNYNTLVKHTEEPKEEAKNLDWASVKGDHLVFDKPIPAHKADSILDEMWGQNGEVIIREYYIPFEEMRTLQEDDNIIITKFSKDEVIGKYNNSIDIRWTPNDGTDIILNLKDESSYDMLFKDEELFGYKYNTPPEYKSYFQDRVYHNRIWDLWGGTEWDIKPDEKIKRYRKFIKYAERFGRVVVNGFDKFYLFDNIAFAFLGQNNERFGFVINGKFDADLIPYIREWSPSNSMYISMSGGINRRDTQDLIDNYDFNIHPTRSSFLTKRVGPIRVVATKGGRINMGNKFEGNEISKTNLDSAIDSVNKVITELNE